MEFFENFDVSDEESIETPIPSFPPFSTNFQEKFWFRNISKENQTATAQNEIDLFRVADFFENGNFEEAKKILSSLRENSKNNRTHEIMLIDSILRCSISISENSENKNKILGLFEDYESILVDFGDQIQFLRTKSEFLIRNFSVFGNSTDGKKLFLETVALLCQLSPSFENWQFFVRKLDLFNDFQIFALKFQISKVLSHEIEHSKGFVKQNLMKKKEILEKELSVLKTKFEEKEISSILSASSHPHHESMATPSESVTSSSEFRAHDCRSKNKLIPKSNQISVIHDFFRRFPFFEYF